MSNYICLDGCAPEPLIHYLKALGIFRLVAEQLDPQARGTWHCGDAFVLETRRSRDELTAFFLNEYQPTPIVAPWNGGSGFYDGEDTVAREAIRRSSGERLQHYREVIEKILKFSELPSTSHLTVIDFIIRVEHLVAGATDKESDKHREVVRETKRLLSLASKINHLENKTLEQIEDLRESMSRDDRGRQLLRDLLNPARKLRTIVKKSERSAGKDEIVRACRNRLDDRAVQWIDVALVISETDAEAPLLGAGGIDGRTEFSKNFMVCLQQALPELICATFAKRDATRRIERSQEQLRAALFGLSAALTESTVGMFFPKGVGGAANASQSPKIDSNESMVNLWDYLLALEGTLLLASATVRQLAAGARSRASFPFTTNNSTVGYGTATGNEKMRAEIWLPLWSRPASFAEVAHIFGEGRVQFSGTRQRAPRTGCDFARAVAELGVDRGIDAFQRYGFLERNGQANLAAPLGRFTVQERPRAALLHQCDRWLEAWRRATRDSKTPPRMLQAFTHIEDASFQLCASGQPEDLQATLVALGAAEMELACSPRWREEHHLRPLTGLSERWANESDDRSVEFELAVALGSITGAGKRGAFRTHLEPVEIREGHATWTSDDTGVIWNAGTLTENLAAVLQRRSIDARAAGAAYPELMSRRYASLAAITAFLHDEIDEERLEALLCSLALLTWRPSPVWSSGTFHSVPPTLLRAYALLKLLFLPAGRLKHTVATEPILIRHEPAIVPLLRAGRVAEALETAERRLRACGLVPLTGAFHVTADTGVRLAASLLIPIDEATISILVALVLRPLTPQV